MMRWLNRFHEWRYNREMARMAEMFLPAQLEAMRLLDEEQGQCAWSLNGVQCEHGLGHEGAHGHKIPGGWMSYP